MKLNEIKQNISAQLANSVGKTVSIEFRGLPNIYGPTLENGDSQDMVSADGLANAVKVKVVRMMSKAEMEALTGDDTSDGVEVKFSPAIDVEYDDYSKDDDTHSETKCSAGIVYTHSIANVK